MFEWKWVILFLILLQSLYMIYTKQFVKLIIVGLIILIDYFIKSSKFLVTNNKDAFCK
jgi:hypothetical protein